MRAGPCSACRAALPAESRVIIVRCRRDWCSLIWVYDSEECAAADADAREAHALECLPRPAPRVDPQPWRAPPAFPRGPFPVPGAR